MIFEVISISSLQLSYVLWTRENIYWLSVFGAVLAVSIIFFDIQISLLPEKYPMVASSATSKIN